MKDGFVRIKTVSPEIGVANVKKNVALIMDEIECAHNEKVNLLVFPELAVTGATCGDLFLSSKLLGEAKRGLCSIAEYSKGKLPVIVVGLPIIHGSKIYDCAAVVHDGVVLGLVSKLFTAGNDEISTSRYFSTVSYGEEMVSFNSPDFPSVPMSHRLIFTNKDEESFTFGVEIGTDLFAPIPNTARLAGAGANIILNCSATPEYIGYEEYRRNAVRDTSSRFICAYALCNAGSGESTQDCVFAGHSIIAEKGNIIAEALPFEGKYTMTEVDLGVIQSDRIRNNMACEMKDVSTIRFDQKCFEHELTRKFDKNPFVPNPADFTRAKKVLEIQARGLAKRITASYSKTAVLGLSGGLDSTLAILVAMRAMDILGKPHSDVVAVTLPCFGTSERTKSNAVILAEALGATLRTIDIGKAVMQHFEDIGHDPSLLNVTFENSQARERTQVLMDIANQVSGLVVGTGDMSELALGWATYNGDHMSMYGVNASVTKTLVRQVVRYVAENSNPTIKSVLLDIIDTPVSPELLPTDNKGDMTQKTEDLVGPYELHDFFLYYTVRHGMTPEKIFRIARHTFKGEYDDVTIEKWLKTFTRRFFAMQFKRSCMPDGPKTGTITLSPRGDWKMPSDAESAIWMDSFNK